MAKNKSQQHEIRRQHVWVQAWCAAIGSDQVTGADLADQLADDCLSSFDERFPPPENP